MSGRTTSTSCIIGAGLKKWMPHTRSGRWVAIAISTTGSVEVLVARMPLGLDDLLELGEQRALDGEVLDDALDDEVAVGEMARGDRWRVIRPRIGVAVVGLQLALRDQPVEVGRDAGDDAASAPCFVRDRTMTVNPERAATSARPAPMIPDPTMPTVLMSPIVTP